jgi:anti-sigma-K factor RskA
MSGTAGDIDDGPQMLAAEFVLGTLDAAEARAADARRAADADFAAEVRFWEAKLYPLTGLVAAVAPPAALWTRIEDSTAGTPEGARGRAEPRAPAANDNRVRWWQGATFASAAVAAGLAAFILLRPVPAPVFAVLAPTGTTSPVLVALAVADGNIVVRPSTAVQVEQGRDLELWALPAGATKPASLGILPPTGKQLASGLAVGTQLLVSLEPKGGSPTGQPTGAVVYGGVLKRAE